MTLDDRVTIVEARRRAAQTAQFGSREAKSGTFGSMATNQQFATRLLTEAIAADRSWASWQAANDLLTDCEVQNAVGALELQGIDAIRLALFRDAVLGSYRLSDPVGNGSDTDKISLCRAAALVAEPSMHELLTSRQWAMDIGYSPNMVDFGVSGNRRMLDKFQQYIVPVCKTDTPALSQFLEYRKILKPIRDRLLAHAQATDRLQHLTIDETSHFIRLTLELASDFAVVMNGSALSAESVQEYNRLEAKRFWSIAFRGAVDQHREYMVKHPEAK